MRSMNGSTASRKLQLLPDDWPDEFEIRGEILMPWDVFEKLNAERAYNEEPLFANPRNAASGTLKMQDPRIVASRHLVAKVYYILCPTGFLLTATMRIWRPHAAGASRCRII